MLFKSNKLKDTDGIWRVDAFGGMALSQTNKVPRIYISLSQIFPENLNSSLDKGVTTGEQKWILEPLNRLSQYLIGSCWENGERISRLSAFEETFEVDTAQIRFVHIGDSIDLNGDVYPRSVPKMAFQFGTNLKGLSSKSLFSIVPVLKNERTSFLVVPCSELYRFYIGVSSEFINRVVTNDVGEYFSWKAPYLYVKRRLSLLEQFVSYRGLCSQEGKKWFNCPSDHIKATAVRLNIATSSNNQKGYAPFSLKATFPFEGKTTLTIAGKRFRYISRGKPDVWGVFAANIIHCDRMEQFDVKVLSDLSADEMQPCGPDLGDPSDLIESPFSDEYSLDESEESPNLASGAVSLLNSSNRFAAMNSTKFKHYHSGETDFPVYGSTIVDQSDSYSYDHLVQDDSSGKRLQRKDYDSHVYSIDRQLTDFVKMIAFLRMHTKAFGWEIATRGCGDSVLEEKGEIITTFLHTKNPRRSWHLIKEENSTRLRQIVWVEVCISANMYIYLTEMEIKGSEARSTLCILKKGFEFMPEHDFKVFLEMTAVQNRWPRKQHQWRTENAQTRADKYFCMYDHLTLQHPSDVSGLSSPTDNELSSWAQNLRWGLRRFLREFVPMAV